MKKLLSTVGIFAALLFLIGGCGMHRADSNKGSHDNSFRLVPRGHHEDIYPGGHDAGGERNCFYSEYDDAYSCPYPDS